MADEEELTPEMREMLGIDEEERLHPILSNVEVLQARANAKSKIIKEQKAAAMKDVEARETRRLRMEEGLTIGVTTADEMVTITIDLPIFAPYINLDMTNGMQYWHGQTYTVPRHKADTLRETMSRLWKLDDEVEGRSLSQHYGLKRNPSINAVTGEVTGRAQVVYDA